MSANGTKTVLCACPHDCPDTCSMVITIEDGRATKVAGNPEHPFTQGGLCVKVNDYQERVYSQDRVLYPLKRSGPKGSGEFERISWDEALNTIKARWTETIEAQGPTAITSYNYLGQEGILNGMWTGDPFFNKLGATITERTFCDSGSATGHIMTIGPTAGIDPESFVHSKYIILWACNTISTNLHHWPFIAEAQKRGAKVVVIDPVRTRTAEKADWHIPVRPGTDAALALGMMNVIIAEDLVDHDYVEKYTVGYDELKERAAEYPPEKVSEITGVSVEDIQTLAREYATSQPAVIRLGVAVERHSGGGQTVRALCSLPALVGAWRQVGGGILQLTVWAFPLNWGVILRPDFITPGTRILNQWRLGPALTGEMELDPPIQSLLVYNSNPVVVAPEQDKIVAGLSREDLFTVVHEQFLTDTAMYADIVLPATTQLEQLDLMYSWGHFYLHLNPPAIEPEGEAVSNTELFRRLAKTMGFDDPFWQRSDEEMVQQCLDWDNPVLEGITLELLQEQGYAKLNMGGADNYAPHAEGNFPTPSGKCELKSSLAEQLGNFVGGIFRQGSEEFQNDGTPIDPLPHYVPRNESAATNPELAAKYPLNILSPKSHAFMNSSYGNQAKQRNHAGEQHIMIHSQDAGSRGLAEGQMVKVFNDRGSFEAEVKITDTMMPGVVLAPMGYWRKFSQGGSTVNAVNSGRYADLGRAPTFSDNLVEVALIES